MEEDDKPFKCSFAGCSMRFTNEDHLTVHKKKHDMVLNFDNGVKTNVFVADQTPTPTRFIRNCEEVGLFQDLQNVNPFEETFRKAVEAAKAGTGPLHEVESLNVHVAADDSLHTPHVFPHIIEDSTSNSSTTFKAATTPVISSTSVIIDGAGKKSSLNTDDSTSQRERQELDQLLHPTSTTGDDNCTTEIVTSSILEKTKVVINSNNSKVVGIENSTKVVRQEADTSQHQVAAHGKTKQIISGHLGNKQGESNVNPESTSVVSPGSSTVQLLLRMPDGKLLQLQAMTMPVEQFSSSEANTVTPLPQVESLSQPSQDTAVVFTAQQSPGAVAESNLNKISARSSVVPVKHSSGISMAKMKLKQTLTSTKRTLPQTSDPSAKLPITKILPPNGKNEAHQISKLERNAIAKQSSSNNTEDPGEKRQKFLARNRVAAMRCREKRKTWIQELERRAEDMQRTNHNLQSEVAALRSEVASLKTLLLAHKDCPVTQAMAQGSTVPVSDAIQHPPQIINVTLPITTNSHPTSVQPSAASQNLILVNGIPALKRGSSEPSLSPAKKILSVNTGSPIIRQALLLPSPQTNIRVINSTRMNNVSSAKHSSSLPSANVNIAPAPTIQPGVLVTNPIITIPVTLPSNPLSISAVIQNSNYRPTITPVLADISGQSAVNNSILVEKETGCEINSHVIKLNPNVIHLKNEEKSDYKIESDGDSDVEIIDAHAIKR